MPDVRATARSFRSTTAALLTTAVVVAPLASATTLATATAAQADGWRPILGVTPRLWFSPNGDHEQDKAKLTVGLREVADVTVKVRRGKSGPVVLKDDLGRLEGAAWTRHQWSWNGKNADGKRVADGRYTAVFRAEAVSDGKAQVRSTTMYLDTAFDQPKRPATSLDMLYPRTTVVRDAGAVTLAGAGRLASVGAVVLTVKDADGDRVRRISGDASWRPSVSVVFDGRDRDGRPLPRGKYTLGFKVTDKAGNHGTSRTTTIRVSDRALVEVTGTAVVPPTGASTTAATARQGVDGRPSTDGGDDPQPYPCGTTVASEVYTDAGATSFRSAVCTTTDPLARSMAWAGGYLTLDDLTRNAAPRGLLSTTTAMRGRPTVAGETDTADLYGGGFAPPYASTTPTPRGTTSPVTTEESVTTAPTIRVSQPTYYSRWSQAPRTFWLIATFGTDAYDVADVTVTYTYLTPEQ